MLRDEVGAKAVNLIDSEIPSDIYEEVAQKLISTLEGLKSKDNLAKKWLELNINRKLTKRPVMTLPYGASGFSCRSFIEDYLRDNYSDEYLWKHFGVGKSPKDCLFKVSLYLSKYLWAAIENTIKAAIEGILCLKSSESWKNKKKGKQMAVKNKTAALLYDLMLRTTAKNVAVIRYECKF